MSLARSFRSSAPRLTTFATVATCALLLAGCETMSSGFGNSGPKIAEVEAPDASFSENIESLSEVVKRNPNSAEAYNTRGTAFARVGRYPEAIADFTQAIRLDPNHAAHSHSDE